MHPLLSIKILQFSSFYSMEDIKLRYSTGIIGNFEIYQTLEDNTTLEIILLSLLDDALFQARMDYERMPESCRNLFLNVKEMFQHIQDNIGKKDMISVSDIGHLRITEIMERKGKEVKIECSVECEKIADPVQLNRYFLKVIRNLRENRPKEPKEPKESQLAQHSKIVGLSLLQMKRPFLMLKYEPKMLMLTVDMIRNPFLRFFTKFHDQVEIQEFSKHRIKLYFNQTIPKEGSYSIKVKILRLKCNAFALGIVDVDQNREITRSSFSIAYQFKTGEIKDSNGDKHKKETHWHQTGKAVDTLNNMMVMMIVTIPEQTVGFYCNDVLVAETSITNYLAKKNITPYISCKHQGDKFVLNPDL